MKKFCISHDPRKGRIDINLNGYMTAVSLPCTDDNEVLAEICTLVEYADESDAVLAAMLAETREMVAEILATDLLGGPVRRIGGGWALV